jgi:hypothetical protein
MLVGADFSRHHYVCCGIYLFQRLICRVGYIYILEDVNIHEKALAQ